MDKEPLAISDIVEVYLKVEVDESLASGSNGRMCAAIGAIQMAYRLELIDREVAMRFLDRLREGKQAQTYGD